MKKTGKLLTLRGSEKVDLNDPTTFSGEKEVLLFNYSSPDQSRGWIVRDAWAWVDMIDLTGGGDARVGITQCLTTDVLGANLGGSGQNLLAYLRQYSPEDNRTIAWNQQDMQRRDSTNRDFVLPTNAFIDTTRFLHDENRVITRELYLNFYGFSETAVARTRVNWYVVLEEVVLNPTESVMQQIKGIAQSID
tara:strand:- start:1454 stop:2029 length:576 start_codon:yes stop_codon:yes gene_type:complete